MRKNAVDAYLELLKGVTDLFRRSSFTKSGMGDPGKRSKKIYTVLDTLGQIIENGDYNRVLSICKKLESADLYKEARVNFETLRLIKDVDDVIEKMGDISSISSSDFNNLGNFASFFVSEDNSEAFINDFGGDENTELVIDMCSFIVVTLFFSSFSEPLLDKIYKILVRSSYTINESSDEEVKKKGFVNGKFLASFFVDLASSGEDKQSAVIIGQNFEEVRKGFVDFFFDAIADMFHVDFVSDDVPDEWESFSDGTFRDNSSYIKSKMLEMIKTEEHLENISFSFFSSVLQNYFPEYFIADSFCECYLGRDCISELMYYAYNGDDTLRETYFSDFTVIGDSVFLGRTFGEMARSDKDLFLSFNVFLNCLVFTAQPKMKSSNRTAIKVSEKYPQMTDAFKKAVGGEKTQKMDSISNVIKRSDFLKRLYESENS
jgi:hypothetical protein